MKKTKRILALILCAALCGCKEGNAAEVTTTAAATTTTAPFDIAEFLSDEPQSEPIYGETSDELVTGVLDAFGAHDKETFDRYAFTTRKYSKIYDMFCRKLPDDVDYKADRTYEDFDIYDFGNSGVCHTYAAFLKEDTATELTIDIDFNYEKEMYYIENINVRTITLDTAEENSLGLMEFNKEE